ncbi:MAG: hypothetical protein JSR37_01215 [Verrucomicrobia bacterium]|nr:hypothetical protein [Verrucomicrobiota bacterium]MBS0636094.1 hypothetical protein [Verrucomicrobiota bacterium]
MSFNEGDPKNEQEEKKSVFSRVGNFFGWLGELIGEQARIDAQREEVEPPLHMMREITLQQQKTSEVIQNAETICTHLEEIKQRLSQEFGSSATCFISKCIDPMIDHAKYLTSALKQPAPHVNNILSQAIESVELYSQFSDERKLKKRIVQVAQGLIKQSIEKDLEVLANYKDDALAKCGWKNGEREENEFQLDGYLYPIISELIGMAGSQAETDDLHAFFVWKSTVDDRRNSLVELGFLTIDALTNAEENTVQIRHEEEDGEVVLEEPFPQLVKHQLEDSALAMSYISTLEDRVQDIFARIEDIHFTDRGSIDQLEQLLEYLKVDSERFSKMGNHTKHVLNSFNSIKANILQAEGLLSKMKT